MSGETNPRAGRRRIDLFRGNEANRAVGDERGCSGPNEPKLPFEVGRGCLQQTKPTADPDRVARHPKGWASLNIIAIGPGN